MHLFTDDLDRNPIKTKAADLMVLEFLLYVASERGLAHNTINAYRRDMEDADKELAKCGKTPTSADGLDWRMYLQSVRKAGWKTRTVARRLACIRVFLEFLETRGTATDKIREQLEAPKPERPLPQVLGREQVVRLINAPDPESRFYFRDIAILELLYACGLRASELCDLKTMDANLQVGAVRVLGKGMKERIVPIGRAAMEAMTVYLRETRPKLEREPTELLFLSRTGKRLSRINLWLLVKRHARLCGLLNEVHPHVLRHCFASHLLGGGADLRVVQELLGHSNVATTQIYTHVDQARLKALHRQFHPLG